MLINQHMNGKIIYFDDALKNDDGRYQVQVVAETDAEEYPAVSPTFTNIYNLKPENVEILTHEEVSEELKKNAKAQLEAYVTDMNNVATATVDKTATETLSNSERETLKSLVKEASEWLQNNTNATAAEYKRMHDDLKQRCRVIEQKFEEGDETNESLNELLKRTSTDSKAMDINTAKSMLPPTLQCNDDGLWSFGNPRSTYETLNYLKNKYGLTMDWLRTSDAKVQANEGVYGTYAGLNDWSPVFTSKQLVALCALVPAESLKKYAIRAFRSS